MNRLDGEQTPVAVVHALRVALDRLGESLAHAQLDDVLAAEGQLKEALTNLGGLLTPDPPGDRELRAELDGVRASLVRCRRLGNSLGAFVRLTLQTYGLDDRYDRRGRGRDDVSLRSMNTSA